MMVSSDSVGFLVDISNAIVANEYLTARHPTFVLGLLLGHCTREDMV